MATAAEVIERIDADLRAISAETDFLPELAQGWAEETETERFVWYTQWRDLMAKLEDVDRAARSGSMTRAQQARYHELLGKLKSALPLLDRLNLPRPPVPLDE